MANTGWGCQRDGDVILSVEDHLYYRFCDISMTSTHTHTCTQISNLCFCYNCTCIHSLPNFTLILPSEMVGLVLVSGAASLIPCKVTSACKEVKYHSKGMGCTEGVGGWGVLSPPSPVYQDLDTLIEQSL